MVEPLSSSIGFLILNWAMIEACLDFNTAIIFHAAGGKHIDREIPMALKSKLKFLRRCFSQIDMLHPFADEAIGYLSRVQDLSQTRHAVVHGFASKYDGSHKDGERFLFVKLDLINGRTLHKSQEVWISGRKIVNDGVKCKELVTELTAFTKRFLKTYIPDHKDYEFLQ